MSLYGQGRQISNGSMSKFVLPKALLYKCFTIHWEIRPSKEGRERVEAVFVLKIEKFY